jgi:Ran GTPase-activating protein (RanGAP) involved in mRNA processing and transport
MDGMDASLKRKRSVDDLFSDESIDGVDFPESDTVAQGQRGGVSPFCLMDDDDDDDDDAPSNSKGAPSRRAPSRRGPSSRAFSKGTTDPTVADLSRVRVTTDVSEEEADAIFARIADPRVVEIVLDGATISASRAPRFANAMRRSRARKLSVRNAVGVAMCAITEGIAACRTLRTVRLSHNRIGAVRGHNARLVEAVMTHPELESIDLGWNRIDSNFLETMLSLAGRSGLRTLNLQGNNLSGCGAELYSLVLLAYDLRSLNVSFCKLATESIGLVAQALRNTESTIVSLDVSHNIFTNPEAHMMFAKAIQINTTLENLAMLTSYRHIEADKSVANALKHNTTLQTLAYNASMLPDGRSMIASALRANPIKRTVSFEFRDMMLAAASSDKNHILSRLRSAVLHRAMRTAVALPVKRKWIGGPDDF